jgi:glycosyltransferase involved in cell wall biosynthesis
VIDSETGWLVPARDSGAITAALLNALRDPVELRRRGAQGRQRLEAHFSPAQMVEQTLAVYRSLESGA